MIDSHCHLAGEEFAGDLDAVVARARAAGIGGALCVLEAGDAAESTRAGAVRQAWRDVRFAAGIHPHHAGSFAGDVARAVATVRESARREGACAIGEIGLDYHYDLSPRDAQQEVFRAQIALAVELALPLVIHTREAAEDTFRLLEEPGARGVGGVFHCFTGDDGMARRALDLGFHLSFAGIVTFPKAAALREAARLAPSDRLLAETDCPFLAPVPHRGKRNEPAYVAEVYRVLAEIRGEAVAALGARITDNFTALFARRIPGADPVSRDK